MKNNGKRPTIQEINKELCKEIQDTDSCNAKESLINKNLEVIDRILVKYKDLLSDEEINDLRQDGFVLLLEEAEKYPQSSVSFRTAFTKKYLVLISRKIKNLKRISSLEDIARNDILNHLIRSDLEDKHSVFMKDTNRFLASLISRLSEKEQKVLINRFIYELSLREIGKIFGVGGERIRQIEAKALRKLRHYTLSYQKKDGTTISFYDLDVTRDDPITNIIDSGRGLCFIKDIKEIPTSHDPEFPTWIPQCVGKSTSLNMLICCENSRYYGNAMLFIYPVSPRKLLARINIQIVTDSVKLDKYNISIPVGITSYIKNLSVESGYEFVKGLFSVGIGLVLDKLTEEEKSKLMVSYEDLTKIEENDVLEKFTISLLNLINFLIT